MLKYDAGVYSYATVNNAIIGGTVMRREGRICQGCREWFPCDLYSTKRYCNHRCRQRAYQRRLEVKAICEGKAKQPETQQRKDGTA